MLAIRLSTNITQSDKQRFQQFCYEHHAPKFKGAFIVLKVKYILAILYLKLFSQLPDITLVC